MLQTLIAIILRIISNPIANAAQKALAGCYPARLINFTSYFIMSLCLFPFAIQINWAQYNTEFWLFVALAGFLCALGTQCLIKALSIGELSIIAPINSYKCVIGLISGFFILNETPNLASLIGLILIVWGSKELFTETKTGFSLRLFKEKYFRLRLYALILTGVEASLLKKIILLSSPLESFILWAIGGMLFSALFLIGAPKIKFKSTVKNLALVFTIPAMLSIMQLSTNYVFEKIEVSLALALFQLSSIISLIFGIVFFKERNIKQKLIGTTLMIAGAIIILAN